jgi:hypothetical protein
LPPPPSPAQPTACRTFPLCMSALPMLLFHRRRRWIARLRRPHLHLLVAIPKGRTSGDLLLFSSPSRHLGAWGQTHPAALRRPRPSLLGWSSCSLVPGLICSIQSRNWISSKLLKCLFLF